MRFVRESLTVGKNAKKNSKSITVLISTERLSGKINCLNDPEVNDCLNDPELSLISNIKITNNFINIYFWNNSVAWSIWRATALHYVDTNVSIAILFNCLSKYIENERYLSPVVINELLEIMGNSILRSILEDIRSNSSLFGLIADESRDISDKEQLTCTLRWVSRSDLFHFIQFIYY